nr:hypothetical protein BSM_02840 [uncultured archaeon]
MYTMCCPNCSDVLHYGIRHPVFAVVTIALLMVPSVSVECFICNEIDLGTDERAEQYYQAILQVHQAVGFNESEYAPSGLTVAQAKEIPCIDTDAEAKCWLSSECSECIDPNECNECTECFECIECNECNKDLGRLYYYILLATYHRWLHPEDAHFKVLDIIDDPVIIKTVQLDEEAYELATVAYFHNRSIVNAYLLGEGSLPSEELDKVKVLLQK